MNWPGAEHLEIALRARGSRAALAKAMGKDPGAVTRWAQGVRPDPQLWPAIEKHLGLDPGTLGDSVSSPVDRRLDDVQRQLDGLALAMVDLGKQIAAIARHLDVEANPPGTAGTGRRRKRSTGR